MSVEQIQLAIMRTDLTNADLRAISDTIQFKRSQLAKENKRAITIGSTVSFMNSRTGQNVQGVVEKIMTKNVRINTGTSIWRVPASMLSVG